MNNYVVKDANQACAKMAYKFSDVSAIYPITPSSPMAEYCEELASNGEKNLFGETLKIVEMQSEAGAIGALHGSLIEGALATTFTASQGLLLMLPNMFKIAGEQLPAVMHISARAVASHALSIFGDHSDVMATRSAGFSYLCSNNAQEAQDMAVIAHISAIKSSLPFLHFFDGFRTSHEIQKFVEISDEDLIKLLPQKEIENFRKRGLNPQNPVQMGTAQNPDVFFQNREASNIKYNQVFDNVISSFSEFQKVTGRHYAPFEYVGDKNAENIIVAMGSACDTIEDFVTKIMQSNCEEKYKKIGLIKVRLYRPFSIRHFVKALPKSVKKIAVLDRTKECGALGEPLYSDIVTALKQLDLNDIKVVGGRYGLGSKEFDSENVASVYENLFANESKNNFTVGIFDDVTNLSLKNSEILFDYYQKSEKAGKSDFEMLFFGLGSDGTVSANKNSIKMIGACTDKFVQGYFEYDSKKSGSLTVSHLRVSNEPIKKIYEVKNADFIAIHNFSFLNRFDILNRLAENGVVLLNTVLNDEELNANLPNYFKKKLIEKHAEFYVIDAGKYARELGLGNKINIIMQSAFFFTSNIISFKNFLKENEIAIKKTYGRKGDKIVNSNIEAMKVGKNVVKINVSNLDFEKDVKELENISPDNKIININENFKFNEEIIKKIGYRKGNELPVSAFMPNGQVPTDTSKFEKRGIAEFVPCWKKENCIQCGRCALVCPHSAIRAINVKEENLSDAPTSFETINTIGAKGDKYRIQVSPLDCTGCGVCASVCPAKQKALEMKLASEMNFEKENYEFSEKVEKEKTIFSKFTTKGNQFEKSMFQFSGACAGCGETPYIKLATTLFGENMIIANATGCSSIFAGSFPTCPYSKNADGFGPAWANSLFEDNAEFGFGISFASKAKKEKLKNLLINFNFNDEKLDNLKEKFIENQNSLTNDEAKFIVEELKKYKNVDKIIGLKDEFFKKSIWIFGGDGWAYDIGYGGLDHILNSNENVNILVLDTEVYSNTGGQASKSTSRGAVAKFASTGKTGKKKDLGLIAIANQNAYVAKIAMGANYDQSIKAFKEAEAFDGPSLIIAYAPCVAHGFNMSNTQEEMNRAVKSGYWELYRYNPQTQELNLDSDEPSMEFEEFLNGETRFSATMKADPQKAKQLFELSKRDAETRRNLLKNLIKN